MTRGGGNAAWTASVHYRVMVEVWNLLNETNGGALNLAPPMLTSLQGSDAGLPQLQLEMLEIHQPETSACKTSSTTALKGQNSSLLVQNEAFHRMSRDYICDPV